jgi:hypothetical protein
VKKKYFYIRIAFFGFLTTYFFLAIVQLIIKSVEESHVNHGVPDRSTYIECKIEGVYILRTDFIISQIFFALDIMLLCLYFITVGKFVKLTKQKPSIYVIMMGVYFIMLIFYDDVLQVDYCFMERVLIKFVTDSDFAQRFLIMLSCGEFIIYLTIYFMFYTFGKFHR